MLSGLGGLLGLGKRPAVLAVDLQLGFTRVDLSPLAGDLDDVIADVNPSHCSSAAKAGAGCVYGAWIS